MKNLIGKTITYIGDKKKQKGEHIVLDQDEVNIYLNNNYKNAKYFIIPTKKQHLIEVKE